MKKFALMLMVSIFFVCLSAVWSESLMVGLSTEELTRNADIVVVGEVRDLYSYWSEDGKRILTRAKVTVNEYAKGKYHAEVDVEYEGGEVGGIGYRVSDVAPLTTGESVLLFLKVKQIERNFNVFSIVGNAQGKYGVKDGIASKTGFTVVKGTENVIDNNIPVEYLLNKIRTIQK